MELYSWNVNGLRAAIRKGFLYWLDSELPDIVCLQEIRAFSNQLPKRLVEDNRYFCNFFSAERPGYSGTAILSRVEPDELIFGLDEQYGSEGRTIVARFGSLSVITGYVPCGSIYDGRFEYKLKYKEKLLELMKDLAKTSKVLFMGDLNTAHTSLDLHDPKGNRNSPGFMVEERQALDQFVKSGFVDLFRHFQSEGGHYTWWSYRKGAKERNQGWRIDYCFSSHDLLSHVISCFHVPKLNISDHCPVGVVINPI